MSIVKVSSPQFPVEWEHQFTRSEFDWVAADKDGCIGYFTSAGDGPVPSISLRDARSLERVDEFFQALPRRCEPENFVQPERDVSEWQGLASKGIYAFDWRREAGVYELISKPTKPLGLADLGDERIRNLVTKLVLPFRLCDWRAIKFERIAPALGTHED